METRYCQIMTMMCIEVGVLDKNDAIVVGVFLSPLMMIDCLTSVTLKGKLTRETDQGLLSVNILNSDS